MAHLLIYPRTRIDSSLGEEDYSFAACVGRNCDVRGANLEHCDVGALLGLRGWLQGARLGWGGVEVRELRC